MKVALVEDEVLASDYLKNLLEKQSILVIEQIVQLSSIKESVLYFTKNKADLIFMDIHLGDGKSLDIFEQVSIHCPVIFVTAYDDYAIKAFKQFTIDYILKPYEEKELHSALKKFKNISKQFQIEPVLTHLIQVDNALDSLPKQRFLVNYGYRLKSIEEQNIAYFSASGKHLFIYTLDGNSYIYPDTIKDVIQKLNSHTFFKINRKYIVNYEAIQEIIKHNSQKIEVILTPSPSDGSPILVSKNQIQNMKTWLNRWFPHPTLTPRTLPLSLLSTSNSVYTNTQSIRKIVKIQADLLVLISLQLSIKFFNDKFSGSELVSKN